MTFDLALVMLGPGVFLFSRSRPPPVLPLDWLQTFVVC